MVAARLRERLARLSHHEMAAPAPAAGIHPADLAAATSALMDFHHAPALQTLAAQPQLLATDPDAQGLLGQVCASAVSLIAAAEGARAAAFAGAIMLAAPPVNEDASVRRLALVLRALLRGGSVTEAALQDQARRAVRAELAHALGKRFAAEGLRGLRQRVPAADYNRMRRELKDELGLDGKDLSALLRTSLGEDAGWSVLSTPPQAPNKLAGRVLAALAAGVRSRAAAK